MEQPLEQLTTPKPKSLRKIGVISLIVVALGIIGISVFVLLNPHGLETNDASFGGVVTLGKNNVVPATIHIKEGDSVTWRNTSSTPHRLVLTSADPKQDLVGFGSDEPILKGETYSFTFDITGSFTYEDPASPDKIKGTIIVE